MQTRTIKINGVWETEEIVNAERWLSKNKFLKKWKGYVEEIRGEIISREKVVVVVYVWKKNKQMNVHDEDYLTVC